LSVIKFSTLIDLFRLRSLDLERAGVGRLLLNASAESNVSDVSVIIMLRCLSDLKARSQWSSDNFISNLTSNQVGLPAELKHINKRRKRN
jgi:hypothetical protein